MNYLVRCGTQHRVFLDRRTDYSGDFTVRVNEREFTVSIRKTHPDGRIKTLMVNHKVYPVEIAMRGDGFPEKVYLKGVPFALEVEKVESTRLRPPQSDRKVSGDILAALPGQIVAVLVQPGEQVVKGQTVVILEAMKMENDILAPRDGTVREVLVKPGDVLAKGDRLLLIA